MADLKTTIDQLKNYLGTGLRMQMLDYKIDHVNFEFDTMVGLHQWDKSGKLWCVLTEGGSKPSPSQVHPICYRLSDLDKFIPDLGFVPIEWFRNHESIDYEDSNVWVREMFREGTNRMPELIPNGIMQKLFEWHFWPFGEDYFEQGLVIDKLKESEVKDV